MPERFSSGRAFRKAGHPGESADSQTPRLPAGRPATSPSPFLAIRLSESSIFSGFPACLPEGSRPSSPLPRFGVPSPSACPRRTPSLPLPGRETGKAREGIASRKSPALARRPASDKKTLRRGALRPGALPVRRKENAPAKGGKAGEKSIRRRSLSGEPGRGPAPEPCALPGALLPSTLVFPARRRVKASPAPASSPYQRNTAWQPPNQAVRCILPSRKRTKRSSRNT